ncbi:ComF family protein [Faecalicatena contorta]|uniref:ComF family protein n=1 Tax=Faecalicatena contorta TaxID=39482 RepID=UPI001F355B35|nr:ComF family protein [Faecalicatena contorta]MCF2680969.1 ComF family protein [Faecalicatena contorta]
MKRILQNAIRLLWPEVCPFCGKVNRCGICETCREKTDKLRVREPRCMKCGKPVRKSEQEYCYDCAHTHHYYDRGMGLWLHQEPVSTSVYQFKYQNQRHYAEFYAKEINRQYKTVIRRWKPDIICPVPLHFTRQWKRGYNQAELLSKELGRLWHLPVDGKLVKRVRATRPQKELTHSMRKANLRSAFAVGNRENIPENILVIDDIYTTGNTIDAVARVLKDAGARKVYFLTISIGQGY